MNTMNRTNIYLSEPQQAQLKIMAKELGISVSELIRRIIDKYLSK
jgi:predicted DNA binding protein